MDSKASARPWILARNRVERFFLGGGALDQWQGLDSAQAYGDGAYSEELLVNTSPYIGPGRPQLQGFSLVEGSRRTLRSLIQEDPAGFLGPEVAQAYGGECPALCKAGDSTGRLILQYHPTAAFSKRYLHCAFGKTEAWYFLQTRDQEVRYCYAGFKPGVTRRDFEGMVARNDVDGMLDTIHKVPFDLGDVILVPAGTIHAMGPGVTFLEVHEPCDYTMRFERDNYGQPMTDNDMHYGLGFKALFDGLDFTPYTAEEIQRKVRFAPRLLEAGPGWKRWSLLSPGDCPEFAMEKVSLQGRYPLYALGRYQLVIALRGEASVAGLPLPQGRAAFVPAGAADLDISAADAEVLLVIPGLPQKKG